MRKVPSMFDRGTFLRYYEMIMFVTIREELKAALAKVRLEFYACDTAV